MKMNSFFWLLTLALLLLGSVFIALHLGAVHATPEILWHLRVPRVLMGVFVGAALALAGVVFQGLLRNPLADPYVLGSSSGASLGVLVAGILHARSSFTLYASCILFSLAAILSVHRIARVGDRTPVQTLILSGVIVSTFLNSLVFLGVSLFYKEAFSTLFFLLGTLAETDPALLRISAALITAAALGIAWLARDLNALSQGDATAFHLGIDPEKTRSLLFFFSSVLVAASVASAGMIGFVGLIVPHILRLIVGSDHRVLLPASALGGALLLVCVDAAARTVVAPVEIPVGVLTALIGTPFFVYLLKKKKGEVF
jgi:iron complex transport system permease protein